LPHAKRHRLRRAVSNPLRQLKTVSGFLITFSRAVDISPNGSFVEQQAGRCLEPTGRSGRAAGATAPAQSVRRSRLTMMVAAGTSTPTSTTVVATSKPVSPGGELAQKYRAVLVGAAHLAMHEADLCRRRGSRKASALPRLGKIDGFGFFHQRNDPVKPVCLCRARALTASITMDVRLLAFSRRGIDRLKRVLQVFRAIPGNVHVAEIGQHPACARGSASRSAPAHRQPGFRGEGSRFAPR
jgi:hypothetical protein